MPVLLLLLVICLYCLYRLHRRQQRLLAEKEWLMNEVHHRVKTNLQLVTSLLNMQVGYVSDAATLRSLGDMESRIRTLSLIHQRLYRDEGDITMINMRDYIHELSAYLVDTFADDQPVDIRQDIDALDLTLAQCVPVGLILNEAIINSLRFAFPRHRQPPAAPAAPLAPAAPAAANPPRTPAAPFPAASPPTGHIDIRMKCEEGGRITLTIADDGIGLPPGFDAERDAAMGFQLIRTLSLQLDGETHIGNRQPAGVSITVSFQQQESPVS